MDCFTADQAVATVDCVGPSLQSSGLPRCQRVPNRGFTHRKPKRVAPSRLARLKNIKETSQVALLVDQYDEDWTRLWYALVRGEGQLVAASAEHRRAIQCLRAKYPQYDTDMLADDAHVLRITPVHITAWGKI